MNPEILLAGAAPPFLAEIVAIVVVSAAAAYICQRLGLVPIVGFLIAGVLISPNLSGLVTNRELIEATAEVGVILLLFTIGLEFSLEKLGKIRKLIFFGGGIQVILTSFLVMLILAVFGINWMIGIFTGFLIALSSTAIVLKILADRGETNTPSGQIGLGLLIFQDLAIIPMVLLVPVLGGQAGSNQEIVIALAKAAAVIAAVLVLARRFMPKVLEIISRACSPEIFLLSVIAICFGTAYLTSLAGVSVSLGAFLAGLVVSESRFSQNAMSEILPLQTLFSATFFVSVGMLLDITFFLDNFVMIALIVFVVLLIKVLTTGVSAVSLGYKIPVAVASGLMLAQIGEFSFVLERAGREVGMFPAGMAETGSQIFIASTVILMILTPFLTQLGMKLKGRMGDMADEKGALEKEFQLNQDNLPDLQNHVIVAGYGKCARKLVRVLSNSGIPYIITTLSPLGANEAESQGFPVIRGDASKYHILDLAGIRYAKMLIIPDDEPSMAHRISSVAHNLNPTMLILVRTRYAEDMDDLKRAGASVVIPEELESIVQLIVSILHDYQLPLEEIERHIETMRGDNYAGLDETELSGKNKITCENLNEDCLDTRRVIIKPDTPIAGKAIRDLNLEDYGITLEEIKRDGEKINPAPDLFFELNDQILFSGSAQSFYEFSSLLSSPDLELADSAEIQDSAVRDAPYINTEEFVQPPSDIDPAKCKHADKMRAVVPSAAGCEECIKTGDRWVHLRICMTCGHTGCCESSKNKHALGHHHETGHPIVKSLEPGEDWAWCYVDKNYVNG
ncbi:MAG: cation:proton antiporter [Deltaproteobacteria bacterium]